MNWFQKDPLSKIAIKYKLPFSFVALYLIIVGLGGYFILNSVYRSLNNEILSRMKSESFAQAAIFDKKLETLARRAEDFSSDGFIRARTEELVENGATGNTRNAKWKKTRKLLQDHLRVNKLPLIAEFADLQIYDLNRHKIAGVQESSTDLDKYIRETFFGQDQEFSPIIPPGKVAPYPTTAIITPLWNIDRTRSIGYLVCLLNLKTLIDNLAVEYRQEISETSIEKYLTLIDPNGTRLEVPWSYLISAKKSDPDGQEMESDSIKVIPAGFSSSANRQEGKHVRRNGKVMFGQTIPLSSTGWKTFIELNMVEAMKPVRDLESSLLGVALIIAISTLVLLFFPVQFVIRPLSELQRMAFKIKEGDFSARININSEDEIGHLANTFNLMAAAVEERTQHLQQTAEDLQMREKELRIQHNRLKTVVNSMTDGLILLNGRNEIVLANKAAKPIEDVLKNGSELPSIRKCTQNSETSEHVNCMACLLNADRKTNCVLTIGDSIFEVVSSHLPALDGLSGKILLARDITERERINEQQAHQERLAVLGKTAAVVAHEMNSPLAAISMYNQMMEAELPGNSPFREHVDVINRNTQICQRIIRDLLDYARLPQPKFERFDLQEILLNVVRFLKPVYEQKSISINYHFDSGDTSVTGDPNQMQQVFVNLLVNAIQTSSPRTGMIQLRT
ncbi:MAG: HAMP domain-containing protein, partial [Chlorobi bacterium]|nr:HAMP domain-containing protein [Chlorobiota bacterium]